MSEIKCYPVSKMLIREQPQAANYARLHGMWSLMSRNWSGANMGHYKSTEDVYRDCMKKGVTWQELLNYKPDPDIIL